MSIYDGNANPMPVQTTQSTPYYGGGYNNYGQPGMPMNPYQSGGYGNDILQNASQRLAAHQQQMAQMNGQQTQNQQFQAFECLPVTGFDEVKAIQVDFSGRPRFYYSAGEGRIYLKQLSDNGAARYEIFSVMKEEDNTTVTPENDISSNTTIPFDQFVTKEDFQKFSETFTASLSSLEDKILNSMKTTPSTVTLTGGEVIKPAPKKTSKEGAV